MDTFSHALWGSGLFGFYGYKKWALFWGAATDLFSFGILLLLQMASLELSLGNHSLDSISAWVFTNYDISHSFVSAFIVIAMVWGVNKTFAFAMLGWPFHICLDFPFHSKDFFQQNYSGHYLISHLMVYRGIVQRFGTQMWLASLCYLSGGISKRNNSRLRHIKIRE